MDTKDLVTVATITAGFAISIVVIPWLSWVQNKW